MMTELFRCFIDHVEADVTKHRTARLTYHTLWGYLQCDQWTSTSSTSSIIDRLHLQATDCIGY